MTGDQARQALAAGRARIEMWKQRLLPLAGQGVEVDGRQVSLTAPPAPAVEAPRRTLMIHIWAQVTMTQTMSGSISIPPEFDENGTYVYPPYLVAALPFSQVTAGYSWELPHQPNILPEAGAVSTPPGEFFAGHLWAGNFLQGTGPVYDIDIEDMQKSAVITLYVRGRYLDDAYGTDGDDPATFATNFNIGRRTVRTLLEGNRASPLPNETEEGEVRVGYSGTVLSVSPISRGGYPLLPLYSVFSITSISRN